MPTRSQVLVTGGTGLRGRRMTWLPVPAQHVPLPSGRGPAVVPGICVLKPLGYQAPYDLHAGQATVRPDLNPGTQA